MSQALASPSIVPPSPVLTRKDVLLAALRSWLVSLHLPSTLAFVGIVLFSVYFGISMGGDGAGESKHVDASAPGRSIPWCPDEHNLLLPTAVAYCHRLGEPGTTQWIKEERERNREEARGARRNCREEWAGKRCLNTGGPGTLLELEDLSLYKSNATWKNVLRALPLVPATWRETWHPTADHVLVDYYGGLWARVIAYKNKAFQPLLLSIDHLIDALDDWQAEIDDALGEEQGTLVACVCPQHLGILSSRLFFRYRADSGWNVFLMLSVRTRGSDASDEVRSRYKYSRAHHTFPLVADDELLATLANRTFTYSTTALMTAYATAPLADPQHVEQIDKVIQREWDSSEPRMAILPAAPPTIDSHRMSKDESECYSRCERLDARMQELTPPPPPPPPRPADEPKAIDAPRPDDDGAPVLTRKKPGRRPPRN